MRDDAELVIDRLLRWAKRHALWPDLLYFRETLECPVAVAGVSAGLHTYLRDILDRQNGK
jgi:hypothetical protein